MFEPDFFFKKNQVPLAPEFNQYIITHPDNMSFINNDNEDEHISIINNNFMYFLQIPKEEQTTKIILLTINKLNKYIKIFNKNIKIFDNVRNVINIFMKINKHINDDLKTEQQIKDAINGSEKLIRKM